MFDVDSSELHQGKDKNKTFMRIVVILIGIAYESLCKVDFW